MNTGSTTGRELGWLLGGFAVSGPGTRLATHRLIGKIMNRSGIASIWTKLLCPSMLVTALLLAPLAASAQQYTAAHKVRRGFANTTLGILAIPGQMTKKTREDGYAVGLPLGFVQGLGWFVVTEMVGIWEILTCPFEFPPRFRPIINPEHPWDSFERGNPGAGLP